MMSTGLVVIGMLCLLGNSEKMDDNKDEIKIRKARESPPVFVLNSPPTFSSSTYSFSASDDASAETSIGTVSITDPDADTWTFAFASGNTNSDFAITNTGNMKVGTIAVSTGKTLDDDTTASYDLRVTINDGTATVTATVTISVASSRSTAATLVPMLPMMIICVLLRN